MLKLKKKKKSQTQIKKTAKESVMLGFSKKPARGRYSHFFEISRKDMSSAVWAL